jgi:hypothetical protein
LVERDSCFLTTPATMASWMPAYFQKRLLRTALSRIALLDVDSLDLDSLGVKIGRSSTVELKNVGLHVQVYTSDVVPSLIRPADTA